MYVQKYKLKINIFKKEYDYTIYIILLLYYYILILSYNSYYSKKNKYLNLIV